MAQLDGIKKRIDSAKLQVVALAEGDGSADAPYDLQADIDRAALTQMIAALDERLVRAKFIPPATGEGPITRVPDEIMLMVLQRVPMLLESGGTTFSISATCRLFHRMYVTINRKTHLTGREIAEAMADPSSFRLPTLFNKTEVRKSLHGLESVPYMNTSPGKHLLEVRAAVSDQSEITISGVMASSGNEYIFTQRDTVGGAYVDVHRMMYGSTWRDGTWFPLLRTRGDIAVTDGNHVAIAYYNDAPSYDSEPESRVNIFDPSVSTQDPTFKRTLANRVLAMSVAKVGGSHRLCMYYTFATMPYIECIEYNNDHSYTLVYRKNLSQFYNMSNPLMMDMCSTGLTLLAHGKHQYHVSNSGVIESRGATYGNVRSVIACDDAIFVLHGSKVHSVAWSDQLNMLLVREVGTAGASNTLVRRGNSIFAIGNNGSVRRL